MASPATGLRRLLGAHLRLGHDGREYAAMAGIEALASSLDLSLTGAMCALLEAGIWPERFRRNEHIFSAADMIRLLQSRVLILGCGGLGGHAAALLARMGVGAMRLCDGDVFEESNLNRQHFCTGKTLGRNKAEAVAEGLADLAPHLDLETVARMITPDELPGMVQGTHAALDCLDHIPMKKSLEQAALNAGAAFVHGSVLRSEGLVFLNASGPARLPLLYPQNPSDEELEAGRREGISALAPAGAACLMCALLAQHLCGRSVNPGLLHFDFTVPELESYSL